MKISTNSQVSSKSGDSCDYLVVDQLPTKFRSYDVDQILVRGLFYEESLALSRYVGSTSKTNYSQLVVIYEDVIKGIDILDLELVDFIILMIISSIWTVDDFGWDPNIRCSHRTEDGHQCTGVIHNKIILDDFEFEDPLVDQLPVSIKMRNTNISVGALTVRDVIEKEKYLSSHPDIDPKIINYAVLIKNTDMTFEDKVRLVRYSHSKDLNQILQIDNEVHIKINPIKKTCPVCSKINNLEITLSKVRGYP